MGFSLEQKYMFVRLNRQGYDYRRIAKEMDLPLTENLVNYFRGLAWYEKIDIELESTRVSMEENNES